MTSRVGRSQFSELTVYKIDAGGFLNVPVKGLLCFLTKILLNYRNATSKVNRARMQTIRSILFLLKSEFSFADTNNSQGNRKGRGPILFRSTISTYSQTFRQLFCCFSWENYLLFLIAAHVTTTVLLEISIRMVEY